VGSGLAVNGIAGVTWSKLVTTIYGLLGSPLYAGVMALICLLRCVIVFKIVLKATGHEVDRNNHFFRVLEILSTGGLAWLHGANDAQKTMGVIAACLLSAGYTTTITYKDSTGKPATDVVIAPWVMFACHAAIGLGTMFGGWSIVGKMALDIYPKMNRTSGFSANTGAIVSIAVATYGLPIGLPVSTTHAMNCGILAAGVGESGFKAVQWKVMSYLLICWIFTIPCTIFVGFSLASLMLLPGDWSPFFCIFWGVIVLAFMMFCAYKQRNNRAETAHRIAEKYELVDKPRKEDPAAVSLVQPKETTDDVPEVAFKVTGHP